jgi:chemotaxis protein methyltransferase CheR
MDASSPGKMIPELDRIRQLAFSTFGLDLRPGKEELIMARIGKVMRRQKLGSFKEYYDYVTSDRSGNALSEMVDALTTNYTSFFRENSHFELLRKTIVPAAKGKKIRIWSAACSTGEEPYSIAFCLADAGLNSNTAEVLATDISGQVLKKASAAIFSDEDLKTLSPEEKRRYFLEGVGSKAGFYKVKPVAAQMVKFQRQNLLEPFDALGLFDVVFCRNVMIYFNNATKQGLVQNLEKRLKPGGYFLVGHSETLNSVQHGLRYISPAVYRSNS